MKLSEKIQFLRNKYGMSQEILSEKCSVSRQCISKWEMDISLPETEKILLLSKIFGVSIDVLLKDELIIDAIKDNQTCSCSVESKLDGIYEGLVIKESIEDEAILDCLNIHKIELWKTNNIPRYWTAITFSSNVIDLPEKFSKIMINNEKLGGNWFVDFKNNNIKYIVFRDLVLKYQIGNFKEKNYVMSKCKEQGITDEQMNWSE
ncbi:MAG: helix-turn-helix transcriptional regulator [Clostridium sp.]|nr:helix-turn-helix transcriptional regulator [Clostridium sp.]